MNTVTIAGRVGRDASEGFKAFESGKTTANFSVAVNRWDSKTKEQVTDWFSVDVWDRLSEFASQYIKKGMLVAIDGRIDNRKWTDSATGNEREMYYIIANDIRLLGSKRDAEEAVL